MSRPKMCNISGNNFVSRSGSGSRSGMLWRWRMACWKGYEASVGVMGGDRGWEGSIQL